VSRIIQSKNRNRNSVGCRDITVLFWSLDRLPTCHIRYTNLSAFFHITAIMASHNRGGLSKPQDVGIRPKRCAGVGLKTRYWARVGLRSI
jgi:hypothetical protein